MLLKRISGFRWRTGLLCAGLVSLAGLFVWWTPLGHGLVNLSYDLPFLFRSDIAIEGVTILYMDVASEKKLGQDRHASWDRTVHAQLLDQLRAHRPKAVVFDALFLRGTNDPAADQSLVRAAKASGNVVTAAQPVPINHEGVTVWSLEAGKPFEALHEVVSWGIAEVGDANKDIREHNHRDAALYKVEPMAWRVAQLTMTNAPPDPYQPRWFNFYGPPLSIRNYSYYKALETNQIPAAHLSNQVIFVGALPDIGFSGSKRGDDYGTPYTALTGRGRRMPGVEVTATAYLNIFRGDWLRRLSLPWEAALLVLIGGLIGFGAARCPPLKAVGLGALVALVLAGLGLWSVWPTHVWFPWLIPVAIQVPCAVVWSVLAHTTRLVLEKRALEQALALLGRGAKSSYPREAARPPAQVVVSPDGGTLDSGLPSSAPAPTLSLIPASRASIPDHDLLRRIGRGAYGEVWLARDAIGTFHAVKIVYRSAFSDAVPLEREFNGIRKFTPISRSHPGFVHILHVGRNEPDGYIYYVMEPGDDEVTGQKMNPLHYTPLTLARLIEKHGRLPLPKCLDICIQLADALESLHQQQLIHRDIKPANIIFVNGTPKFADIGLVTDVATKGRDVTYLGTPGRIAPEGPGTPASDVFSLGKVIYEAGLGLDLSRFPDLPTAIIQSPAEAQLFDLNRIILKACEKDVKERYGSAATLRDDLLQLQRQMARGTVS